MLTTFDDYPIHQTPEPIAQPATSDRNVYDRFWFNGYADDGEFYFGVALGRYPHRHVQDAALSVVHDGEQHAFHASRRAPRDPRETQVGPLRLEVLEPMRRLRVVLAPNETGISGELLFTARTACVEEGRQTLRRDGRVIMDATRFAQFGRWEGSLRFAGRTLAIEPGRVLGTKDRSWGIRPIGEPEPAGAPPTALPQVYFLWAPLQWDDHCTHTGLFEDADGRCWHRDAAIVPAHDAGDAWPGVEDPKLVPVAEVRHRIEHEPGTRRVRAARLELVEPTGAERTIELEPLLRFQMKGLGYLHPEWGHGVWKGELAIGGESWKSDELDPLALENLHVQQVVRARAEGRTGVGALEHLCIGPHAPSGFRGLLDGAR